MPRTTILDVLNASINAERLAETLFLRLEAGFAADPNIAAYFRRFAADEASHAAWLTALRSRLDRDDLDPVVDPDIARLVEKVAGFSLDKALANVHDLDDAYNLVCQVEHGETNAIFRFLVHAFEPDPRTQAFLDRTIEDHVSALDQGLPSLYRLPEARRMLKRS